MRIAARMAAIAAAAMFACLGSIQAAPVGHTTIPPLHVLTVGSMQERITQPAPGYVRPPRRVIVRRAEVEAVPEHRHLPHGHHGGSGNLAPAHPEEVTMPAQ